MKVFFVNTNRQWGGGEKWHFDTAFSLMKKGHPVAVLSNPRFELYRKAQSSGIRTLPVRITNLSFLNPFRVSSISRMLKKEKPDVIILNYSADIKTAGMAAAIAGVPKIIYRRGNARPIKNSILNRYLFNRIITHIIANSQETKKSILLNNNSLVPSEKIQVFYNGINLNEYDRLSGEILYQRKPNEIVIGCAGRLSKEKGHAYLVEAASELRKTHHNFVILLAGTGPEEIPLKNAIASNNLENHIRMLGFVENIKSFMNTIDFFVLPSLWEGFGYVTIEAMAARKPVIAFNTGSNPEIIITGSTGILVNDFNIKTLAESMGRMTDDSLLRDTMGVNGRARVEKYFDMKVIHQQLEDFLLKK